MLPGHWELAHRQGGEVVGHLHLRPEEEGALLHPVPSGLLEEGPEVLLVRLHGAGGPDQPAHLAQHPEHRVPDGAARRRPEKPVQDVVAGRKRGGERHHRAELERRVPRDPSDHHVQDVPAGRHVHREVLRLGRDLEDPSLLRL